MTVTNQVKSINERFKRSWPLYLAGAALLLLVSIGIFALVLSGKTRETGNTDVTATSTPPTATSTLTMVPRRLDGVLVPVGQEAWAPRAVMIDNQVDARPQSGVSKANVVIESPVEGGITRLMALFDATTTVNEVGPVRSARPYFVDWARGWDAEYFHVGGSPDALDKIRSLGPTFANIDEMGSGRFFWRDANRYAPHSTYTDQELMTRAVTETGFASSTASIAWHFQDQASSTQRGGVSTITIPYGGSYSVVWKFDKDRDVYVRYQAGRKQLDRDGSSVESDNVIVIKTDAQVLDEKGRLSVRTTGSGDAIGYRDGNRYSLRWRRSPGEQMRFETNDGTEFQLNRGRTWVQVTTDDRIFGGVGI